MIYLILDTNIWIYLANGLDPITSKHHDSLHFDLLKSLKELKQNNEICVLVNELVINEWKRNKESCKAKIKNLQNKLSRLEDTFSDIAKYAKEKSVELQKNYTEGIKQEITANENHILDVENFLFNDCQKVEISQDIKLKIFDLSISNKAPFHNRKNNTADATILLSAAEFYKNNHNSILDSAIFVSNNFNEFTDGVNKEEFHADLLDVLEGTEILYRRILPAALKLSKEIIQQMQEYNDLIQEMADHAEKQFVWDIDRREKGAMMFLDVEYYQRHTDSKEYLSLVIAKDRFRDRPNFMSVILPSTILQENGIFINFGNVEGYETGNVKIKVDDDSMKRIPFDICNEETCTLRFYDGWFIDSETQEKVDIFQKFLNFDQLYFLIVYPTGAHKVIFIPLSSFQQQYSGIDDPVS